MPDKYYVFLDPDGTQGFGLIAIVAAPTRVTYAHQCGGLATEIREIEGFAVPLGGISATEPLCTFFRQQFGGNPPTISGKYASIFERRWTAARLDELGRLVGEIMFWKTVFDSTASDDQPSALLLDRTRLSDLTEAWIPVKTAYGAGVLIFPNSD